MRAPQRLPVDEIPPPLTAAEALQLDDKSFERSFRLVPKSEVDALEDGDRAEWFRRVNCATDYVAKSTDQLRREQARTKVEPEQIAPAPWGQALDLEALAERSPEPPSEIMQGLPCGYAALVAGHGGAGKSSIELTRAVCIAAGISFCGLPVNERRRVLYLSCEDRENVLHWRLSRICAYLGVDLAGLRGWLEVVDLVGCDSILWDRDPRTGYTITPAFGRLSEKIREHETEVLFVDGTADTFGGNENARGEVKRYVNALVSLIPPERGAVVLIAHVAKGTANGQGGEGYSGSTAWHNSARARWYLHRDNAQGDEGESSGDLILELQKSNLGRADQQIRFKWDDAAHLFIGKASDLSAFDRKHQDREEQAAIRRALKGCMDAGLHVPAAMMGPRTAYLVLSERPEFPASLKGIGRTKSRRFWRQIETLRHMLHIEESSIERKHRKHTATLVLTSEGRAICA